ncbi:two-component system, OmpR family, sensor histidine kinase QseC [Pseudoalteromonas aurantia 208]|uniref:histidine kinase n=2 Tax=Pseudoalteromonas aurantia TaxID=43654 RepID=A0ABR9EHT1_9GAMM|nr:two-component system, OmpR family, sensor histidine kinase QseC [Pseudoalteromonas aurantia 208]
MQQAQQQMDAHLHNLAGVLINAQTTQWPENDDVYAKLWDKGRVVFSAKKLIPISAVQVMEPGIKTTNMVGLRLRVLAIKQGDKHLIVGEPMQKRFNLTESLILSAMMPLVVAMPILALFIAWYIRLSLLPLTQLSKELKHRKADNFERLNTASTDAEVAPVIERLNSLFTKVEAAYLRERYFASDAAHELKTPISSLKIHLHNVSQEMNHVSFDAMALGLEQLTHIVEQMLTLARTEPDSWQANFTNIDVLSLTQTVVSNLYPRIELKRQQISLEGEDAYIRGCEFTLSTLFINLISNAIKYSPNDGSIQLSVLNSEGRIGWQIDDSGTGMSEAQIARVFDRFYRVGGDKHPSGEKGAGLGMAIVSQILAIYGAKIVLQESHLGGLRAQVWFLKEQTCVTESN